MTRLDCLSQETTLSLDDNEEGGIKKRAFKQLQVLLAVLTSSPSVYGLISGPRMKGWFGGERESYRAYDCLWDDEFVGYVLLRHTLGM